MIRKYLNRFHFEINPSFGIMITVFLHKKYDADALNELEISILCFSLYYCW